MKPTLRAGFLGKGSVKTVTSIPSTVQSIHMFKDDKLGIRGPLCKKVPDKNLTLFHKGDDILGGYDV